MIRGKRSMNSGTPPRKKLRSGLGGAALQSVGGGGSSVLLQDTFIDTNGTNLSTHTMTVGPGWTLNSGSWDIQSNQANTTGVEPANPAWVATADSGYSDTTASLQAQLITPGFNSIGLIFRFQNNSNFWSALITQANKFRIYETNATVFTVRAEADVTIDPEIMYTIQVVTVGTSITATMDGANSINFTSSFLQTQTKMGMRGGGNGEAGDRFANFLVTR